MSPLTQLLNDPANLKTGQVLDRIKAGLPIAPTDLDGTNPRFKYRNGKSRTSYYETVLLTAAMKAKNLAAFTTLVQAGHTYTTRYTGADVRTDTYKKVFAPYENWVLGGIVVVVGNEPIPATDHRTTEDELPLQFAEVVERQYPGSMQQWAENAYHWHQGGVATLERMEAAGVRPTPRVLNNVLYYLRCSMQNKDAKALGALLLKLRSQTRLTEPGEESRHAWLSLNDFETNSVREHLALCGITPDNFPEIFAALTPENIAEAKARDTLQAAA